jgi:LysM repeat protein
VRSMALIEPEEAPTGAGEAGLPPHSDADELTATQEESPPPDSDLLMEIETQTDDNAEGLATTQEKSPPPDEDLTFQMGAPVDSNPRERPPEIVAALDADEPLDPALEQLFLEANAEAAESALVSEPPDIPMRELLNELVALGRSLGIEPSAHAESSNAAQASAELERSPTLEDRPATPEDHPATPEDRPATLDTRWPMPTFSRSHALNGMLLSLTLVMAVASVLIGADHIISGGQNQNPQLPAVATVTPGVAVRQVPNQPDVEPAQAPPTATATPPSAYFLYTVQEGDTLTAIAATFGLSLDHILWTNPDVIDDPDLLLVGDKLLIPNVAGIIYYVEPGDVLSAIGHLLPTPVPEESGTPSGRPGPP